MVAVAGRDLSDRGASLSGRRALVLGAESPLGQRLALALAEAGADVAAVAAATDPDSAFAVQRLARRIAALGRRSLAQAIDGGNEMALRVMARQVGKELGGLDAAALCCAHRDEGPRPDPALALPPLARELARSGGGAILLLGEGLAEAARRGQEEAPSGVAVRALDPAGREEEVCREAVRLLAGAVAPGPG